MPALSFRFALKPISACLLALFAAHSAFAADWVVSSNDGKYQRVQGQDTYPANPAPDTLTVLDASVFPPKVKQTVEVENAIQGPPTGAGRRPDPL
jgi:hypothetical protein